MNKQTLIGVGVGVVVFCTAAALAFTQSQGKSYTPPTNTNSTQTTSSNTNTAPVTTYTAAQVAAHGDAGSCWTTVNGTVYDLTTWIAQHPGGEGNILSMCGKDGSAAFEGQHSGQRRPENVLASFKIGTLAQ